MTQTESQMYDLGRQARHAGFKTEACNLSIYDVGRAWWLAGWHDTDYALGIRIYTKNIMNEMQL